MVFLHKIVKWWFFPEFGAELPLDNCNWPTFMKCKHTKRLLTAVRRHLSELRSKRRNAKLLNTAHHKRKLWEFLDPSCANTYSYLKCIVYDKLLKPRQSFRITLYNINSFQHTPPRELVQAGPLLQTRSKRCRLKTPYLVFSKADMICKWLS